MTTARPEPRGATTSAGLGPHTLHPSPPFEEGIEDRYVGLTVRAFRFLF